MLGSVDKLSVQILLVVTRTLRLSPGQCTHTRATPKTPAWLETRRHLERLMEMATISFNAQELEIWVHRCDVKNIFHAPNPDRRDHD